MIPVFRPPIHDRLRDAVLESLDSLWWGYGPRCHKLETTFVANWGGHAVATSSCTAALYLAGLALRARGSEVIVPAMTFISTGIAFAHSGHRVVVADVDPDTLMVNRSTIESLLTHSTAAVVAVHLYGQRCNVEELSNLCRGHGAVLIEDRAHRVGLHDAPAGDIVCLSFNAVKEAPAGEGGLLWCRHERDALAARRASYLGMDVDPWDRSRQAQHRDYVLTETTGLKLRMHDLAAALVLAGLDDLNAGIERRRAIYHEYRARTAPSLQWPERGDSDSFLMMVGRTAPEQRDSIRRELSARNVATSVHYPPLTEHPAFASSHCPIADAASREIVTLPSSASLTDTEVQFVIDAMERVTR